METLWSEIIRVRRETEGWGYYKVLCCVALWWASSFLGSAADTGDAHEYDVIGVANGTLAVNVTVAPTACPPIEEESGCIASLAGAVVGALIIGIVVGAAVMYCALKCLEKRHQQFTPPKDYDMSEPHQYDVNRNSDETGFLADMEATDETSSKPPVKAHKKLERLVKPTKPPKEKIEIPTAATPLIEHPNTPEEGSKEDKSPAGTNNSSSNNADPDPDAVYQNTEGDSRNSQPYEALAIIPEEVEYENVKLNTYEMVTTSLPRPKAQEKKAPSSPSKSQKPAPSLPPKLPKSTSSHPAKTH